MARFERQQITSAPVETTAAACLCSNALTRTGNRRHAHGPQRSRRVLALLIAFSCAVVHVFNQPQAAAARANSATGDVAVTIEAVDLSATVGGISAYRVVASYVSPEFPVADGVAITVVLPAHTTVDRIFASGLDCSVTDGVLSCNGVLVGSPLELLFTVRIDDDPSIASLEAAAQITGALPDPNPANDDASVSTTVVDGRQARSDVSVSFDDGFDELVDSGVEVVRVSNAGPETAFGVVVDVTAAGGTISPSPSRGVTRPKAFIQDSAHFWYLGTMLPGEKATLVLTVKPGDAPTLEIDVGAVATQTTPDVAPDNNQATRAAHVQQDAGDADLTVRSERVTPDLVAGDYVTYLVWVDNTPSGDDSPGTTVLVPVPAGTRFVSASTPAGVVFAPPKGSDRGTVVWRAGTLVSGAGATLAVSFEIIRADAAFVDQYSVSVFTLAPPPNLIIYSPVPVDIEIESVTNVVSWEPPDPNSAEDRPPPRNLAFGTSGGAPAPPGLLCYNVYSTTVAGLAPEPGNLFASVPPTQTSIAVPIARGGSYFQVTACYATGQSSPTGETGQNRAPGPTLAAAPRVSGTKLIARGTGFTADEIVLVDGFPFVSAARLKRGGTKVVQRSPLLTGETLEEYLRPGRQAIVTYRNQDGGTTRMSVGR